jgi:hypothetical protein
MTTATKKKKLASAAISLSQKIAGGEIRMSSIGKGKVFTKTGKPCCIVGHIIDAAGLKGELGSKFSGAEFFTGVKWAGSCQTLSFLLGRLSPELGDAVGELECRNDTCFYPQHRKMDVLSGLVELAAALRKH